MIEAGDRPLADAPWLRAGPAARVLALLDTDGEEARVVGGAVRNALLGEPVSEVDIATTATPEEVVRRASAAGLKTVPTGIEHGTVTIVVERKPFEVTTLRRDVETDGRRAKVAFGRDWLVDAERRDFTMNALSASPDGTLHDPVGGRGDLEARRVRFIGDADRRIAEDHLRILRFFRFHAVYGAGEPDAVALAACTAGRDGLERLSRERVRMEMLKLVAARRAAATLAVMREHGLLVTVLGGVPLIGGVARMAAIEAVLGVAADPVRRLGALAVLAPEDAARLSARWRLTRAETQRLVAMAQGWRDFDPGNAQAARTLIYRLGALGFEDRAWLAFARSGAAVDDRAWVEALTLPQRWAAPVFPLKAADFIARGVTAGPALGAALRTAEEAWIAAGFPSAPDALARLADAAARR